MTEVTEMMTTQTTRDTSTMGAPIDMSVDLAGMRLPNPLMTASGCAANGRELHRFFDITDCHKAFPTFHFEPLQSGLARVHREAFGGA